MPALDHFEPANAAADIYAVALVFVVIDNLEPGRLVRKFARRDGELNEAPHFLDFFFLDVKGWVEILHFTGDSTVETGGVETSNGSDAVVASLDGFSYCFRADSTQS